MIGTHIHKSGEFFTSLAAFFEQEDGNKKKPVQIFSGAAKWWRRPMPTLQDIEATKTYIKENELQVFVHSIYLINLAAPRSTFMTKPFKCLKWELEFGAQIGFKGVVVHCGKHVKLTPEDGLANMLTNMRAMLPYITPSCPLLLETCAGQGTELCKTYEGFKTFYAHFTEDEQQKIRICIDTCHVFAAGHDPLKFITDWDEDFPGSLVLVHFNDSKEGCGCCKDRHAAPGTGEIGLKKMTAIAKWCIANAIPMVVE